MKKALVAKFNQNPQLLEKLLATRGKELLEASPSDNFWGVVLGMDDPRLIASNGYLLDHMPHQGSQSKTTEALQAKAH
jgi:predicted NAD-dependent protein-ADP-ribosyltransferase YbiA (DUF1768 family)